MELRIRKHGNNAGNIIVDRPVKIILTDGQEFNLRESDEGLVITCIDNRIIINPSSGNQIWLSQDIDS